MVIMAMRRIRVCWRTANATRSLVRRRFGSALALGRAITSRLGTVFGGGGGGGGHDDDKHQEGEGAGFGLGGRPAGAYVIRGSEVKWEPAVDPNRIVTVLGIVAAVYLLVRPRVAKVKARAARRR